VAGYSSEDDEEDEEERVFESSASNLVVNYKNGGQKRRHKIDADTIVGKRARWDESPLEVSAKTSETSLPSTNTATQKSKTKGVTWAPEKLLCQVFEYHVNVDNSTSFQHSTSDEMGGLLFSLPVTHTRTELLKDYWPPKKIAEEEGEEWLVRQRMRNGKKFSPHAI